MELENRLLKITEVAEMLGYSEGHVRNLVSQGKIPYKKLSRKALRFESRAIEQWIIERNFQTRQVANQNQTAANDRRSGPPDRRVGPTDRRAPAAVNE